MTSRSQHHFAKSHTKPNVVTSNCLRNVTISELWSCAYLWVVSRLREHLRLRLEVVERGEGPLQGLVQKHVTPAHKPAAHLHTHL